MNARQGRNRAILRRNIKLAHPHGNRKGSASRFKSGPVEPLTGATQTAHCGKRDDRPKGGW